MTPLGLKNSRAFGFHLFLEKNSVPNIFIKPSEILVLFLACFHSITQKYCLHLVCNAAVTLLNFLWPVCVSLSQTYCMTCHDTNTANKK